jgi:hypothetical protein
LKKRPRPTRAEEEEEEEECDLGETGTELERVIGWRPRIAETDGRCGGAGAVRGLAKVRGEAGSGTQQVCPLLLRIDPRIGSLITRSFRGD